MNQLALEFIYEADLNGSTKQDMKSIKTTIVLANVAKALFYTDEPFRCRTP